MNSNVVVKDCFKVYRHDQDKVRTPEETVAWVRKVLESVDSDILSTTMRVDTGRLGIPVYISLCGDDATRLTGTKKQMGKGATPAQSEASALMELMERYSFFSFVNESHMPLRSWSEIGNGAIDPELLRKSVHDDISDPEACRVFLRDFPLRWVAAKNLSTGEDQWIPFDWFYLINEYNGPAAGNTVEEAILQGLCEVVERHVGSIISHLRMDTPGIDPGSLRDPASMELFEKFEHAGIKVFLRDFSLDTGIPTVGVTAYDPATFPEKSEIVFTAGTTSNPEKSLCRALTEVAQLAGDFENRTSYRPTLPKYETLEDSAYLMRPGRTVPLGTLPNLDNDNLRVEIERCVTALGKIGLQVFVVNVTHPDLQVPAVYVIVPGAHFLDHTRDTDFAQHSARTMLRSLPPELILPNMERLLSCFGPRYDLTFFLAHSLELEGRADTALNLFKEALKQNPDEREVSSIHVHIGSCLKDLGRFEEALEALAAAEEHNSELKEIYNLRGFCLYRLKKHMEAISSFERAIELDPGSAIDYANIGSNMRELGHLDEAIRLYRIALELDPDLEFARDNIAKLESRLANQE